MTKTTPAGTTVLQRMAPSRLQDMLAALTGSTGPLSLEASPSDIGTTEAPPPAAAGKASLKESTAQTAHAVNVLPANERLDCTLNTRKGLLAERNSTRSQRRGLQEELKAVDRHTPERFEMARAIQELKERERQLNWVHDEEFVPLHSPHQLVGPQQLLMSRLFNVRPKTLARSEEGNFEVTSTQHGSFSYEGPELRQSDGLVFMALVNMARDFKVGTAVSFDASDMCQWLFGYYDGPGRTRLRQAIHRLQHALLIFEDFSVQLAMRFHFPSRGRWTVMLDPEIVKMFKRSQVVWLDVELRKSLPDGLTSWLYAYVEGQTTLIPQRVDWLREMCGSEATDNRSFHSTLTRSLRKLVEVHVLDEGWSIRDGVLHWRKALCGAPRVA